MSQIQYKKFLRFNCLAIMQMKYQINQSVASKVNMGQKQNMSTNRKWKCELNSIKVRIHNNKWICSKNTDESLDECRRV